MDDYGVIYGINIIRISETKVRCARRLSKIVAILMDKNFMNESAPLRLNTVVASNHLQALVVQLSNRARFLQTNAPAKPKHMKWQGNEFLLLHPFKTTTIQHLQMKFQMVALLNFTVNFCM